MSRAECVASSVAGFNSNVFFFLFFFSFFPPVETPEGAHLWNTEDLMARLQATVTTADAKMNGLVQENAMSHGYLP
jgi:hypothetical protein